MAKKLLTLVTMLLVVLTLTCTCSFAEGNTTEWITLEEVRNMYTEAIGNDTFKMTIHSSYWWEETNDGWYQFECSIGRTSVVMNVRGEHIHASVEVLDKFETYGAYLQENGRFIIDPEIFPWEDSYGLVVDSSWGEILLDKWIVDEFINHCIETKNSEWITVDEARQIFKEAIDEDCSFEVTCRTSYQIDGNRKAWLQLEAKYGNVASATGIWDIDIELPLSVLEKLEECGATREENQFVINPAIFPYDTPYEVILEDEWGEILLNQNMVVEFLEFCLESIETDTN